MMVMSNVPDCGCSLAFTHHQCGCTAGRVHVPWNTLHREYCAVCDMDADCSPMCIRQPKNYRGGIFDPALAAGHAPTWWPK